MTCDKCGMTGWRAWNGWHEPFEHFGCGGTVHQTGKHAKEK